MRLLCWILQVNLITVLTNAGPVTTPTVGSIPNSTAHAHKDSGEYKKSLREANSLDVNVSTETGDDPENDARLSVCWSAEGKRQCERI
uniref:RxLR effector candidate protein n=1 Tax=Hyaloperonospora arabidopsidis (strain Emoy2) TaxID=559515 RepID=M4BEP4_HYAAE